MRRSDCLFRERCPCMLWITNLDPTSKRHFFSLFIRDLRNLPPRRSDSPRCPPFSRYMSTWGLWAGDVAGWEYGDEQRGDHGVWCRTEPKRNGRCDSIRAGTGDSRSAYLDGNLASSKPGGRQVCCISSIELGTCLQLRQLSVSYVQCKVQDVMDVTSRALAGSSKSRYLFYPGFLSSVPKARGSRTPPAPCSRAICVPGVQPIWRGDSRSSDAFLR